jgi:hypothetical protein
MGANLFFQLMSRRLGLMGLTLIFFSPISLGLAQSPSQFLPSADDIPEEILRTEIILEGRSPLDGVPLTATEYTELMEALAESPHAPQLNPKIRHLVFLLKVRKFFRTLLPFL